MQEIHLAVAGLDGGDGPVAEIDVIDLRRARAVRLLQQMAALVILEQRRAGRSQLDEPLPERVVGVLHESAGRPAWPWPAGWPGCRSALVTAPKRRRGNS